MLRPGTLILNTNEGCGGDGPRTHPNNTFGAGRRDAVQPLSPFPIYTNQSVYNVGDPANVWISLVNPLPVTIPVDVNIALDPPAGPRVLIPLGTVQVPGSFKAFDLVVSAAPLAAGTPSGSCRWVSLLVVPGGDPNNPADVISEDFAPFAAPRRAVVVVPRKGARVAGAARGTCAVARTRICSGPGRAAAPAFRYASVRPFNRPAR
jgi:hypothetical protein